VKGAKIIAFDAVDIDRGGVRVRDIAAFCCRISSSIVDPPTGHIPVAAKLFLI
jgi:hypothetical protein